MVKLGSVDFEKPSTRRRGLEGVIQSTNKSDCSKNFKHALPPSPSEAEITSLFAAIRVSSFYLHQGLLFASWRGPGSQGATLFLSSFPVVRDVTATQAWFVTSRTTWAYFIGTFLNDLNTLGTIYPLKKTKNGSCNQILLLGRD